MKFKFSLEKLLNQRQLQVGIDRRQFIEKRNERDSEVEKLEAMIQLKTDTIAERARLVTSGSSWQNDVDQINLFLLGQDVRIAQQHQRLQTLEKEVEFLREILLKAVTEARMVEKLKENKKAEFFANFLAEEQKELDEVVSMRSPIKAKQESTE